jgi:signal transduction histidine kinase
MNPAEYLNTKEFFHNLHISSSERHELIQLIEDYLFEFLSSVILESEEILAIDPNLNRKEIIEVAAEKIAKNLKAEAASIRLFDPISFKMHSFGAYGIQDSERSATIPVKGSIAGKVVEENRSIIVSSIMRDPLFKSKEIVAQKGFHSLIAVPLQMPSFVGINESILGSLQIYYKEDNRQFCKEEIIRAEMLARRVSYVLAKKKIIDLKSKNDKKEMISDKIFIKLSNREGVKLKDFFNLIIPELDKILQIYSCSLYSLSDNQKYFRLESTYPPSRTYHDLGHLFTLDHHDYLWAAVHSSNEYADLPHERISPSYVLIKDPIKSKLVSSKLREFADKNQIHSILLVPLRISSVTRHVLCFFATQQKQYFNEDDIELLTYFGKETMKTLRLEFLGDMLHDFKNPAVAIAGLALRSRKLLDSDDLNAKRDKLILYQDVIVRETTRLQDMALTMTGEGRGEEIDLGKIALERYQLNEVAIKELKHPNLTVKPPMVETDLIVLCPLYGLNRTIDNLLNNATKAIPKEGGYLEMSCFRSAEMACLEVRNSGEIPQDQIDLVRKGLVGGRGLNIISRFIQNNHGKIDIATAKNVTKVIISLPLHSTTKANPL